jgi:hypothetical protein
MNKRIKSNKNIPKKSKRRIEITTKDKQEEREGAINC